MLFLPMLYGVIYVCIDLCRLCENNKKKNDKKPFRIWRENTYQNDHLKQESKFLCIQSLVLGVKGLKQGYICTK